MTRSCAENYRKIVGRKMIIWDNSPVNDRNLTLHLGPFLGRDPDLAEIASGYMSNPLSPQNEANRVPLFTCADSAFSPAAYTLCGPSEGPWRILREIHLSEWL